MNKIKIAFISNTFVWSCAICWKKFKNHAISPRITHFLLLTGFWRLFHRVHGRLAFPPSFSQLFGVYLFLTLVRDQSTAARVAFSRGSPTSPSSSWTKLWQLAKTWINHSKKLFQFKLWIYEFHNILLKSQEICCSKRQYIKKYWQEIIFYYYLFLFFIIYFIISWNRLNILSYVE